MTPEQRRLREAHLARRALVRVLRGGEIERVRTRTITSRTHVNVEAFALCRDDTTVNVHHHGLFDEWLAHVEDSRHRNARVITPTLTNIADQVRAAILATHGPEALP